LAHDEDALRLNASVPLISAVDRGFAEMRGRLDATAAGLDQITSVLNTLIGQEDDR
jgi:hypothetical protein